MSFPATSPAHDMTRVAGPRTDQPNANHMDSIRRCGRDLLQPRMNVYLEMLIPSTSGLYKLSKCPHRTLSSGSASNAQDVAFKANHDHRSSISTGARSSGPRHSQRPLSPHQRFRRTRNLLAKHNRRLLLGQHPIRRAPHR